MSPPANAPKAPSKAPPKEPPKAPPKARNRARQQQPKGKPRSFCKKPSSLAEAEEAVPAPTGAPVATVSTTDLVYPFRCKLCIFKCRNFPELEQHKTKRHQIKLVFICETCELKYPSQLALKKHLDEMHSQNLGQVSTTSRPLEGSDDEADVIVKDEEMWHCKFCIFRNPSFRMFKLHMANNHGDVASKQPVNGKNGDDANGGGGGADRGSGPGCPPGRGGNSTWGKSAGGGGEGGSFGFAGSQTLKTYKCRFNCLYRHASFFLVRSHEQLQHAKDREAALQYRARVKSRVDCKYCDSAIEANDVRGHMKRKHAEQFKKTGAKIGCSSCDFSAEDVTQVKAHRVEIHPYEEADTDEEDLDFIGYSLEHCRTNGLINYSGMGPKFDEEGRRFLYCSLCEFRDVVPGRLTKHKKALHPDPPTIQCSDCSLKCYDLYQLRWHLRDKHGRAEIFLHTHFLMKELRQMKEFREKQAAAAATLPSA